MTPLSIVVLTQNEADNIERCLRSISWCADIILIDNSTDATVARAKKIIIPEHLRIFTKTESEDFSYLRNFGLEKAQNDWVLFLDADEEVSRELKAEIEIALIETNCVGFYLSRADFFMGKWLRYGETADVRLLKLGKKNTGRWEREVHETWKISGKIDTLRSPLLHFPHPTVAEFLHRINRWSTLDAQVFYHQGIRSSWWKVLAYPSGKFLRNYIFKLGFLDGTAGIIVALMMSFHSFLTRAKLYMLDQKISQKPT